jgi:pyruvate dehydrogenase E1 component alpha subunit/2-oxoisovalerate dehydrogenase E1 component alpha subunit
VRGFIGQISHLGDMVPVMAGVTLSFKLRNEPRVGLVYVGDGATSTGAFHEGINFAAVQRCPLVVIVENNGYAYSTPTTRQTACSSFKDKAIGYGIPGVRADGNDVVATYQVTKEAVDRARAGEGVTLIELVTYRRKGHAEHDNQSYVPAGEIDRWARENDPVDRYIRELTSQYAFSTADLETVDNRVKLEIDRATDEAEASPAPEPMDALSGVYADPAAAPVLWFRGRPPRAAGGLGNPRWLRPPISRPSGRDCSRRWSVTPRCSAWAKISGPTVARSRLPKGFRPASASAG